MDFGAIAIVSGVTRLTTPPRVVTAVSAVDRGPEYQAARTGSDRAYRRTGNLPRQLVQRASFRRFGLTMS